MGVCIGLSKSNHPAFFSRNILLFSGRAHLSSRGGTPPPLYTPPRERRRNVEVFLELRKTLSEFNW